MFYLDRHVSTQCVDYQTCSCACSYIKRRVCAHFFWLTNSWLCVSLKISYLVCNIIFHRCTRNKVLHHDFLTYEPFSLCNFWLARTSHTRTCLFATCHLISHVLFRLPRFHTNVSSTRRVHAHVRTLQDECLHTFLTYGNVSVYNVENIGFTDSKDSVHCKKTCLYTTFWLTWSCACANFNTRTHVCVQFRT